jgi:hypothetical protein
VVVGGVDGGPLSRVSSERGWWWHLSSVLGAAAAAVLAVVVVVCRLRWQLQLWLQLWSPLSTSATVVLQQPSSSSALAAAGAAVVAVVHVGSCGAAAAIVVIRVGSCGSAAAIVVVCRPRWGPQLQPTSSALARGGGECELAMFGVDVLTYINSKFINY